MKFFTFLLLLACSFLSCGNTDDATNQSALSKTEAATATDDSARALEQSSVVLAERDNTATLKSKQAAADKETLRQIYETRKATNSTSDDDAANAVPKPKDNPNMERFSTATEANVPVTRSTPAPVTIDQQKAATIESSLPDHTAWNNLLTKYVNAKGNVDYRGLKNAEAKLDTYLKELANRAPRKEWNREDAMAYWINAYNAFTVKLILKNWPVERITDLHNGKPWDVKWIELGDKTYSLNEIEHSILRPRFKDARIHFAVNCAAQSCPPLHNRAFTAANLDGKLQQLTTAFINNERYNTIAANQATVSKIFDWYGEDFGNLRKYLNRYSTTDIAEGTGSTYKEYDWALNGQ